MDSYLYDTSRLQKAIDFVKQRKDDVVLLLVVKVKTSNEYIDQYDYSTEFFSEEELMDYIDALESLGIYRDISYGEDDFVHKISQNYFEKYPQKYKIVFNTTGSKRIRSRSTLIPALCELVNLRYASSDILTCSLLENKVHANSLLAHYGFPIPKSWTYHPVYGWMAARPPENIKLIIKPAAESASIGVTDHSIGYYSETFDYLIKELSNTLLEPVIVQEFIEGWEVETPVLNIHGPLALPPMGIELNGEKYLNRQFLSFETIYSDQYNYYRFDCVSDSVSYSIMKIAEKSYRFLDLCGTVRVDFRVQSDNHFYITDYNNSPHLTRFHSVAKSMMSLGFNYQDLFCLLLYNALLQYTQN